MLWEEFEKTGEYAAMGAFENIDRGLFYRKAVGIKRYYENCKLYEYDNKPLYPSGAKDEEMIIRPSYLNGLDIAWDRITDDNKELVEVFIKDFLKFSSKVPQEHTVAGNMYCHSMPNYGRIIREGLASFAKRAEEIPDDDLREGLLCLYEGIECYVKRCVDYLEEVNADERLIAALKKVPLEKADNIYEAIVSWNFVMYLDNCDNLGCLAKELDDFYNGEDIVYLLENLYDNLDANDGYSMSLYDADKELIIQCLKAAKGKRRPMIELFVDENTEKEIWDTAFNVMRSYGGQPAFYNPRVLLEGLKNKLNISEEDIKFFCGGGCTESMIAGKSNVGSVDAGINLLLIFEKVMYDYLPKAKSFDDFCDKYIENVRAVTEDITEKISISQKERAQFNPLPMRTFLVDDCIDKAKEYNNGGARYCASIINFAGMINVIDSMAAIKELVFGESGMNTDEFLYGLKNNDKVLLEKCRNIKHCFGRDDEENNSLAYKISHAIFSASEVRKPYLGGAFLPASIQFMSQVYAGKNIGATPDGRESGAPLCDSLGAVFGKDLKGPTALLKSVSSLDLKSALGVPVLNFNIDPSWDDDILKALILSYMELGGIQMQITCLSKEMLLEAYENPDMHKNLVVRVGGYSEYFYRLSDELKRMVMNRSIQKM